MLFKTVALAAVFLASTSSAFDIHERHAGLEERNGGYGGGAAAAAGKGKPSYQFQPGIQTATGDTCAAAFGNGYQTCREAAGDKNRLCYNPGAGQKCCSASWSCPNGSFCLADGVCCPDGMDAASCGASAASSSAAAAAASSTSAPTSATASWSKVKPTISSAVSVKPVPTSFAPIPSKGDSGSSSPEASAPAQATTNAAVRRDSMGAAGVLGAGLVAVLAAF